jgi:enoyl-CoA hydratase
MLNVEDREGIAVVRFDRPPANAMNSDFFAALAQTLDRLGDGPSRAVVITGTGRFFSAGLDLFEVFSYPADGFTEFTRRFDRGFRAAFTFAKPLVAAVNGHAIAGGTVLAACADRRLMADGAARAGLTELQVGVTFPVTAYEITGYGCAGRHLADVLLRAQTYPPAAALERNLVDEVVPEAELLERSIAVARELAAIAPAAFAQTKRALRAEAIARIEAVTPGADPIWDRWRSPEVRASVEAYRQRALRKSS